MFRPKRLIMALAMALLASLAANGNSTLAEEDAGWDTKAKKVKRIMKRGLVPHPHGIGVPKTGQTISYAIGDDGDLQKGIPYPEPRFIENGDGTTTDRATGLMWITDVDQIPQEMNWHDGIKACSALVFAGHENWRLPNARELLSLADYGMHDPSLPRGHSFRNVQPSHSYWSSTTALPHTTRALRINMSNGILHRNNKSSHCCRVWPVRRGRRHNW